MTRYEFAAMLYRAIENGAALEEKIIKEFEPELGRIRVDRISGEDGDRDKIERVRVNDTKASATITATSWQNKLSAVTSE